MKHHPTDVYPIGGLRILLLDECAKAGGIRAWGRANGVSYSHVSRVIRGEQKPGPLLLGVLGLEKSTVYVPARKRRGVNGKGGLP